MYIEFVRYQTYFSPAIEIKPDRYLNNTLDAKCQSLIKQVRNEDTEAFILGTPFFNSYTVVFDYQNNTIEIMDKFNFTQPHTTELVLEELLDSQVIDFDYVIS